MKEKKANWFTNNSWWLFIVLLVIDIVLLNFVYDIFKNYFLKYGVTWEENWPLIVYFILAIIGVLITFFMMYFIIYLEDSLHGRNKKKIKMFETFIEKIVLKGGKD